MILWTILHITDWLLWLTLAGSVGYVVFFALASLFSKREDKRGVTGTREEEPVRKASFLVLYPAYHEDAVIVNSVRQFLLSDYPEEKYHVAVISDHMEPDTNRQLAELPITLLQPVFEKSSKAKALQFAVQNFSGKDERAFDYVVILDADNVVRPDFLHQLNRSCAQGHRAIQCHRCAKNSDNDIAVLDGISEEINNTLFRRAHNVVGLSSALIGSGMCFSYQWFCTHVGQLNSAVEDRELEAMLMKERVFVRFEDHIPVYDEKVSSSDNFQRQRLRWMTGQEQTLLLMLPSLPKAIATGNVNFIDKTIQQALLPRSILLALLPLLSLLVTLLVPVWGLKWWLLTGCFCLALLLAIPRQLRTRAVFSRVGMLPRLVWRMVSNVAHIDKNSRDFIHTTHNK